MLMEKYYENQNDITNRMRIILVDWLYEVCSVYKIDDYIYMKIIFYLDKFIEKHDNIERTNFQAVGLCCILLSTDIMSYDKCVYVSDHTYTKEHLIKLKDIISNNLSNIYFLCNKNKINKIDSELIYFVSTNDILFSKFLENSTLLLNIQKNKNIDYNFYTDLLEWYENKIIKIWPRYNQKKIWILLKRYFNFMPNFYSPNNKKQINKNLPIII